jgi:HK97 family phage prohead protease
MRFFGSIEKSSGLGPRQIRVVASTGAVDRAGDIVVPAGADLTAYRSNPVVLRDHDPRQPVGTATLQVTNSAIVGIVNFAPAGMSEVADESCQLAKAGVLRGVSIGFNPIKSSPIRGGGVRYEEWELLEISLVSVPANAGAVVVERSLRRKSGRSISAANTEKLCTVRNHLEQAADHLDDVLGDADGDETKGADMEFYRRKMMAVNIRAGIPPVNQKAYEIANRPSFQSVAQRAAYVARLRRLCRD